MTQRASPLARRSILRRIAIGVAAAAAALVAGKSDASAAMAAPGPGRLHLYGRSWHARSQDLRFGEVPSDGDRYAVYGELLDAPDGAKVGEFYAACFYLASPFSLGHGTVELHTLNLADGTLVGVGSGSGAQRTYAIVGGTGRYAGARGSYVADQSAIGLGGDGAADFQITLI